MILPPDRSTSIFAGRRGEIDAFHRTLAELTAPRPKGFFFSTFTPAPDREARLHLIEGPPEIGKTALVRQFAQSAAKSGVAWVGCRWDEARDAGALPADLPAMLSYLHNAIIRVCGQPAADAFSGFRKILDKHAEAKSHAVKLAAEARSKVLDLTLLGAKGIGAAAGELAPPGMRAIVNELAKSGVELAGSAVVSFAELLAARFSREDYDLYSKPAQSYAAEFVKALVSLGEAAPLVLALDSFELIAPDILPGEFRALIVKPCLEQSAEIVFVLAGRTHQREGYEDAFDSAPRRLHRCDLTPLTPGEVGDYLEAATMPRQLAEAVYADTLGLPSELSGALDRVSQGTGAATAEAPSKGVADLIARLPGLAASSSDSGEEVSRKAVDRHRIYALALIHGQDPQALMAAWATSDADTRVIRAALKRAYSPAFEEDSERIQRVFRDRARSYLRERIEARDGWTDEPALRRMNQAALENFVARLTAREASLPSAAARMADPEWKHLATAVIGQRFWFDSAGAMKELCLRLLEAHPMDTVWAGDLMAIAAETPAASSELFRCVRDGVAAWTAESGSHERVVNMWNAVAAMNSQWRFTPEQEAWICFRRAARLFVSDRRTDGLAEAGRGLAAIPDQADPGLRGGLLEVAVACVVAHIREKEYRPAAVAARQLLARDPSNGQALMLLTMALSGEGDFSGAHQAIDAFASSFPRSRLASMARIFALGAQGRNADAELRRLAEEDPEAITKMAESLRAQDSEAARIARQIYRDGGSPIPDDGWRRCMSNPEAAAEITAAYLRLRVKERPAPEEVRQLKQLTVDKFPDWAEARVDLGAALLASGDIGGGIEQFERASALDNSFRIHLMAAELLTLHGLYEKALPVCQSTANQFPAEPSARSTLIRCLALMERQREAMEAAENAVRDFPDHALLRFQAGSALVGVDPEKGWRLASEAYRSAKNELQFQMGVTLAGTAQSNPGGFRQLIDTQFGQLTDGERAVVASLPTERQIWAFLRTHEAWLMGKSLSQPLLPPLIEVAEALVAARPDHLGLRGRLADILVTDGQPVRAAEVLEAGLPSAASRDEVSVLHQDIAGLYQKGGDEDRAVQHLEAAGDAASPQALYLLAWLQLKRGNLEGSLETYRKANAAMPDTDIDSRITFAQASLGARRFEEARQKLSALLEEQPGHSGLLGLLATALYYQGDFDESVRVALQAHALAKGDPGLAAVAARSLSATGADAEAAKLRTRVKLLLGGANSFNQACALAVLGEKEEAIARLTDAFAEDRSSAEQARWDPDFLDLRALPSFKSLTGTATRVAAA